MSPKNKKHLNLNFLTTVCVKHLHFLTNFHNFTLKKKQLKLQGCLNQF